MRVEIRVADRFPLTVEVDGTPLIHRLAPFAVSRETSADQLIIEYMPNDHVDKVCGFFAIPFADANGKIEVHHIWVPPPPPFSDEDVRAMWTAVLSLDMGFPSTIPLQGAMESALRVRRRRPGEHPRDELLAPLAKASGDLLAAWPQRDTPMHRWRPVEVAGGVENASLTVREGWRAGILGRSLINGRVLPARSARRALAPAGWNLAVVARYAHRVADVLRQEYHMGPAIIALEQRLSLVGRLAQPRDIWQVDPPTSSWPRPLLRFTNLAWRYLEHSKEVEGNTRSSLPLCEVWRLYESWVSARLASLLTGWFGPPSARRRLGGAGERWLMVWTVGTDSITVEAQYRFGPNVGYGYAWRGRFCSVTATLVPDALVALTDERNRVSLLVIDAKERSGAFGPDDAAAAAAKYLWGLRAPDFGFGPDPVEAMLVTSRLLSPPFRPDEARMKFAHAVPTDDASMRDGIRSFLMRFGSASTQSHL